MKFYNPAFRRVLHKGQTPSADEIELLNCVDDLERLAFGEGNYTSFRLKLRSYAETEEGGGRLTEKERLRLLHHRISELKLILIRQGKEHEIERLGKADNNWNSHHHDPSSLMLHVPDTDKWIKKDEDTENKK